jgi:hypothetical protein
VRISVDLRQNAGALTAAVGLLSLAVWLAGLGFAAALPSRPVLIGYQTGVALILMADQLGRLTGVRVEGGGSARSCCPSCARPPRRIPPEATVADLREDGVPLATSFGQPRSACPSRPHDSAMPPQRRACRPARAGPVSRCHP